MSFTSLINLRHCKVTRETDVLLNERNLVAGAIALDHQPPRLSSVSVKIANDSIGTGTVTVWGAGAVPFEILTFWGPPPSETQEIVDGIEEFNPIASVNPLGFAYDGTIEVRAITPSGQPIYWEKTIFEEMPCWCDLHAGGVIVQIPGGIITSVTKLFTEYNPLTKVKENDIVYFRDRKYRIDYIETTFTKSQVSPHHLEIILKQAKTNED